METVSSLVKVSLPNYLSGLPIPNSVTGWFKLGCKFAKICKQVFNSSVFHKYFFKMEFKHFHNYSYVTNSIINLIPAYFSAKPRTLAIR